MKKLFCFVLIILIISNSSCVNVPTDKTTESFKIIYQKNLLDNIPERDELISSFERDRDSLLKGAENYTQKKGIQLDLKKSLKMYFPKLVDVYNEFKSGKKFSDLISDDCYYTIPMTKYGINQGLLHMQKNDKTDEKELRDKGFSDETVKMIKDKEGKITFSQMRPMIEDNGYEFFTNPDKMAELLNSNNIVDILDIKFITAPALYLDFAYINSSSGEFCIPFMSRPEFANLTNGKVYKMDDIIGLFNKKH